MDIDEEDLSFITLSVLDENGLPIPNADNIIEFEALGSGEIVATDNGDPADLVSFNSSKRKVFSGLALVIVRAKPNQSGEMIITAKSEGLTSAQIVIKKAVII